MDTGVLNECLSISPVNINNNNYTKNNNNDINLYSELSIFTTTKIPEGNNGFCGQPGMMVLCKAEQQQQQQHRKCARRDEGEGNQVTCQFVGGNKMPAARSLSAQK